jgi:tripartite-type tricarboxylate transporter receptor subunit TctC
MPIGFPRRVTLLGGAALLAAPALAQGPAQAPARRPVTVIVPYSAGSPPDIIGRLLAEGFARRWGQPFIVDNRVGASANIGTAAVARAVPDGQTLLVTTVTLGMNASLFRQIPYDPIASFAPVAELATVGFALLLHPSGGADLAEFLARARARPGALNYASPGIGTPHHLVMEMFRHAAGIDITHIPYRGLAGAVTDLLAGQVAAMFVTIGAAREAAQDGRVRLVAVAAPSRLPAIPATPTLAELGVPGVAMSAWYGLFAPAGTPPEMIARLNATANEVMASPEVLAVLATSGTTPVGGVPERLAATLAADLARWPAVIRDARITPE